MFNRERRKDLLGLVSLDIISFYNELMLEKPDRTTIHKNLQFKIESLAYKYGYKGLEEYPLLNYYPEPERNGYVDVVWLETLTGTPRVFFEIDSSPRIKSVNKLLFAKALFEPFRVWVYYGKKDKFIDVINEFDKQHLIHVIRLSPL